MVGDEHTHHARRNAIGPRQRDGKVGELVAVATPIRQRSGRTQVIGDVARICLLRGDKLVLMLAVSGDQRRLPCLRADDQREKEQSRIDRYEADGAIVVAAGQR
jgi:hypothetical protein